MDALTAPEATVYAAVIAAVTAVVTTVVLRYFIDSRLMKRKAATDYTYEQRKVLRAALGRFDGQLLDAAESLHNRLLNLYDNPGEDRLLANVDYFYRSTVFRFVAFFRLAVGLEQAALYLDPQVASKRDRLALRYVKALRWVMTDRMLFEGLPHTPDDHFHGDRFRALLAVPVKADETFDFGFFEATVVGDTSRAPIFAYFDGLAPGRTPLRWDRVVAMHLLLMAYMQTAGFDELHRFSDEDFARVARELHDPTVRTRLRGWFLPEMKLEQDKQAKRIVKALA